MHLYQKRVLVKKQTQTPTNIDSNNKQCIYTKRESLQETDTKPLQTLKARLKKAAIPIESPCKRQTQNPYKRWEHQKTMHLYL